MKLKTTTLKPKFSAFVGLFILALTIMFLVRVVFHFTTSIGLFDFSTTLDWFNFFFYPLFISLSLTYGVRRIQLVIEDPADLDRVREWILSSLRSNGLRVKYKIRYDLDFESTHRFSRIFNNWFGMEITTVKKLDRCIIVEGPFRHVDFVDSKLRFGKEFSGQESSSI